MHGGLEEVDKMKSVPNWISYLHEISWIFSPFLDILVSFLKLKIDSAFLNF
jgi:hypothetical protein